MAIRIYTKTGAAGETGLFGGARVRKDDLRVEAYGTVDELNAALGLAVALGAPPRVSALLTRLQALLFELGAELATAPTAKRPPTPVGAAEIHELEQAIDTFEAELEPLQTFILPGGSPVAAVLHLARTVCRRAERRLVTLLGDDVGAMADTLVVLNRLSDLLFVMARFANRAVGATETVWTARRDR